MERSAIKHAGSCSLFQENGPIPMRSPEMSTKKQAYVVLILALWQNQYSLFYFPDSDEQRTGWNFRLRSELDR